MGRRESQEFPIFIGFSSMREFSMRVVFTSAVAAHFGPFGHCRFLIPSVPPARA